MKLDSIQFFSDNFIISSNNRLESKPTRLNLTLDEFVNVRNVFKGIIVLLK